MNKTKIVIIHPHGNQNTSKVVSMLSRSNMLDTFWTTIAFPKKFAFFSKKIFDVEFNKIKLRFVKELFRRISILFKLKKIYLKDNSIFSVHSIYKDLDLQASKYLISNKSKINAVYSYEDCALSSFQAAKDNNIKTIYDLTSPYWRYKKKIIEDELKLHPDWKLSSTEIMSESKCIDKEKEIVLSDKIIVASTFAKKSLESLTKSAEINIRVIPYGVDCPEEMIQNKRKENKKFKILFVGRPTLSKGIQYLIETLKKLQFPWELSIAGEIPEKPYEISKKMDKFFKDDRCKFLGQISNQQVKQEMTKSHVFLFPSLYDGFGQVLLEAMSCSLPIISTYNTGANDIIENGKNGFLTNIRDVNNTNDILHNLYQNEEFRLNISENSYLTSKKYSWQKYEKKLENFLVE